MRASFRPRAVGYFHPCNQPTFQDDILVAWVSFPPVANEA